MNLIKKPTIILPLIVLIFFGYNKWLFSWGLFDLFKDNQYSTEGMLRVDKFNPNRDILYLPKLKDKKLFQAVNDLSICRKREVRKYIYLYLTAWRPYTVRAMGRSQLYLKIINDIFEQNKDIPKEIALLPLLESGFDPMAVSKSKAVGLWQFLRSTARHLGLRGDKWIEERRDIEKSTEAAIRHLRNLHRIFNSWGLALAAYNGGGGKVKRAMQKTGAKDIWQLQASNSLSMETREYLPKFLALLIIYQNQSLFGIDDEIGGVSQEETSNIELNYALRLSDISKYCGVDRKTILKYNPELRRSITPPTVKTFSLRLPTGAVKKFKKNKKKLYKRKISRVKLYRVRRGDSISKIARKHRKSVRTILKFNKLRKPYLIRVGQLIQIPL